MSINLQKGQKIDLTKGNASLDFIMVGLGWDAQKKKSLFGLSGGPAIDCDSSVIMLNKDGKVTDRENVIYFGNKMHDATMSVIHMGDNVTGRGEGDDEQIKVYLSKIPQDIHRIVFVVNIYDCKARKQDFGMIKNAYIRLIDMAKKVEMMKFNLTDNYSGFTAVILGEVYRHGSDWKFFSSGEPSKATGLNEILEQFR